MPVRDRRRFSTARATIIVMASVAALIAIIISPLALQAIAVTLNLNWAKLSNIGQAYGAISALIAGLALAGVVISVFLQAREARHSRWAVERERHLEIMRIAIENPFYRQVFALPDMPEDMARLSGYINLLLFHWSMSWEFGDMSEDALRDCLASILYSGAGRSYWQIFRDARLNPAGKTDREIMFNRIADAVYQESMASSAGAGPAAGGFSRERCRHLRAIVRGRHVPGLKRKKTT